MTMPTTIKKSLQEMEAENNKIREAKRVDTKLTYEEFKKLMDEKNK